MSCGGSWPEHKQTETTSEMKETISERSLNPVINVTQW
jgi:hypothetical protein